MFVAELDKNRQNPQCTWTQNRNKAECQEYTCSMKWGNGPDNEGRCVKDKYQSLNKPYRKDCDEGDHTCRFGPDGGGTVIAMRYYGLGSSKKHGRYIAIHRDAPTMDNRTFMDKDDDMCPKRIIKHGKMYNNYDHEGVPFDIHETCYYKPK